MLLFLASEKFYTLSTEDGYDVAYIVAPNKEAALKIAVRSDENGPSVLYPHFDIFELGYFAPSVPVLLAGREQESYEHGGFILSSYTVPFPVSDFTGQPGTDAEQESQVKQRIAYRKEWYSFMPVDGWEETQETHGYDHTFPVWRHPQVARSLAPSY